MKDFLATFSFAQNLAHAALVRLWMWVGMVSLGLGGLYAIVLVLARTPGIQKHLPFLDFFHTALVVHVDLTVLVWFLANAGLLLTLFMGRGGVASRAAAWAMILGMVVMAVSPWVGESYPLMNNYVPVLQQEVFFLSLGLIVASVLVIASVAIPSIAWEGMGVAGFAVWSAAVMLLAVVGAVVLSSHMMPEGVEGELYYETLFWGGGHMLQFVHTQLVAVVWLGLALAMGYRVRAGGWWFGAMMGLGLVTVLLGFVGYSFGEITDWGHRQFFTWMMILVNGGYVVPVGLAVLWALVRGLPKRREDRPVWFAVVSSLVLFGAGGLISTMIREVDVTIPAHYHGSIVGVSLAYMALYYWLLPRVGCPAVVGKWACWQPVIYGGGQLLHITGLMISGGYDVARKTVELGDDVARGAKIGMGLMGAGGMVAIIGGIVFVVVAGKSLLRHGKRV